MGGLVVGSTTHLLDVCSNDCGSLVGIAREDMSDHSVVSCVMERIDGWPTTSAIRSICVCV
jgi:hypothetical protein